MAGEEAGDTWNSGESITVTLTDADRNLNSASDEDLTVVTTWAIVLMRLTIGDKYEKNSDVRDSRGRLGVCYVCR
jgi:hypothetical protein